MKQEWRSKGKCHGDEDLTWIDPNRIPVPLGADSEKWRNMIAGSMCSGCPVITECRTEVVELGDYDQVKGGYALSKTDFKYNRQHNEIRAELGIPLVRTRMDDLAEKYPRPCRTCGRPYRVFPMKKSDFPDTVLGRMETDQCGECHAKREIGNEAQETRQA